MLLTSDDVTRCIVAIDATVGMLERDRQIDVRQRNEIIAELRDTRAKLAAGLSGAVKDVKRILPS